MGYQSKWIFAVCVFAGITLMALPAVGQKDVLVVNTPARPIPTAAQGTTNVTGTVTVGNTPNVNVANTPSVNVANTANVTTPLDGQGNPIPLAVSEAYHPFQDTCTISFGGNGAGLCLFKAPAQGTRIVVEQFDAATGLSSGLESGCKPVAILLRFAGLQHFFPATFMGNQPTSNQDFYATHQDTRIYGDPGVEPVCAVGLSCTSQAS